MLAKYIAMWYSCHEEFSSYDYEGTDQNHISVQTIMLGGSLTGFY